MGVLQHLVESLDVLLLELEAVAGGPSHRVPQISEARRLAADGLQPVTVTLERLFEKAEVLSIQAFESLPDHRVSDRHVLPSGEHAPAENVQVDAIEDIAGATVQRLGIEQR